MTVIYAILVAVICFFVDRKSKSHAQSDKKISKFDAVIFAVRKIAAAFLIVYIGIIIFIFDWYVKDYWLFFGEKRTGEIQSKFGIIVDDDVKLTKYKALADSESLTLVSDIDGFAFMNKNCQGSLVKYRKNDSQYSAYEEEKCKLYKNDKTGIYRYVYQGQSYTMEVDNVDNKYSVKILLY